MGLLRSLFQCLFDKYVERRRETMALGRRLGDLTAKVCERNALKKKNQRAYLGPQKIHFKYHTILIRELPVFWKGTQ